MHDRPADSRGRLLFAGVLGLGLTLIVAVLVLTGGEDSPEFEAADSDCISAWNDDEAAVSLGVHQFSGHGYEKVEVSRLGEGAQPQDTGSCAVIFAAPALDAELIAAAQILTGGSWRPLSELPGVTTERLGELQIGAATRSNATLGGDGRMTAR